MRAQRLAYFCLVTGVQPSEYHQLTIGERDEFLRQAQIRDGRK